MATGLCRFLTLTGVNSHRTRFFLARASALLSVLNLLFVFSVGFVEDLLRSWRVLEVTEEQGFTEFVFLAAKRLEIDGARIKIDEAFGGKAPHRLNPILRPVRAVGYFSVLIHY